MNILRKQVHHNDLNTSNSVTPSGSEEEPLNMQEYEGSPVIKEEVEDYVDNEESFVGIMAPCTNIKIEEEKEDCSNEWEPSLSQTKVKSEPSSREASPLRQDSKRNETVTSFRPRESPQQSEREEEKNPNNPSNKRVIKKKAIFDPSDTSSSSHKKRRKKAPQIVKNESCNSETKEDHKKDPELLSKRACDKMSKSCKYCGKYVKQKYYMRLHYMKHTGETPHKCTHCKNAYRTRWRLTQHMRTHTNSQPYHCPYCNYRGNRSDYITSHINRRHYKELYIQKDKKEGMADSKE